MNCYLKCTACLIAIVGLTPMAHAGILINGDFEDLTGWGAAGSTDPPASWSATSAGNPATQQSGADAIGGSGTSAHMEKFGSLFQSFTETSSQWQFDIDFASEDPGTSGDRNMSGSIFNGTSALITYRVNGDGDFQIFERGGASWHTPTGLAGAVIFDIDVAITPLVHHLRVTGHFDLATPSYDVEITDSSGSTYQALGLTSWNRPGSGVGPTTGQGITKIDFAAGSLPTGIDYVIDNVTVVPEPGAIVLLMGVLPSLLLCRCRK